MRTIWTIEIVEGRVREVRRLGEIKGNTLPQQDNCKMFHIFFHIMQYPCILSTGKRTIIYTIICFVYFQEQGTKYM